MDKIVQAELDMLKDIIVHTVPVEQIHLFGSYAYGTPHKDSDLDIYVVLKDNADIRDIDAGIKIRLATRDKKKMPTDIIVSKKSTFSERKNTPSMERMIAREGICIYEDVRVNTRALNPLFAGNGAV
jgi:predicted nucleotidyltransferase